MQICYEISVLGMGYRHRRARTGIFRVVENLAIGLANHNECDVVFASTESANDALNCELFLKSLKEPLRTPFKHCGYEDWLKFNSFLSENLGLDDRGGIKKKILGKLLGVSLKAADIGLFRSDILARDQFDVFHSPFLPLPGSPRKGPGKTKRFLTIHDLIPVKFPQFLGYREDLLFRRILGSIRGEDRIFAISQSTKNDLCDYADIDPERVHVVYPAVDRQLFHPSRDKEKNEAAMKKYGIPAGPYLLGVSTLEPRKNLDHLIQCFKHLVLQQRIEDLNLVLVGVKGWKYRKIIEEVESDGLGERIVLAGYIDDSELPALFSEAVAFVYPSIYEGFGLPPLEAMSCGAPVVTSNTSSLPEVVGDAGITVDPFDRDALCQCLFELYEKEDMRLRFSRKSIERAKNFTWDKFLRETLCAYRESLAA